MTLPAIIPAARRKTPDLVTAFRDLAAAHLALTLSGTVAGDELAKHERGMTDLTRTLRATHRREIADSLVEERRLAEAAAYGPVDAGTAARLELISATLSTAA